MKDINTDFEMQVQLKTHCRNCGQAVMTAFELMVPDKEGFSYMMEKSAYNLNEFQCPRCAEKTFPKLTREWQAVWNPGR